MGEELLFSQRIGLDNGPQIDNDCPESLRKRLSYELTNLYRKHAFFDFWGRDVVGKLVSFNLSEPKDYDHSNSDTFQKYVLELLLSLEWYQVYDFCEWLYQECLDGAKQDPRRQRTLTMSPEEIKEQFSREINRVLVMDNMAFVFEEGRFVRHGHAHLQNSQKQAFIVMSDPRLEATKDSYNEARGFFENVKEPNYPKAILTSIQSLEAAIESLTGEPASQNFTASVKKLSGNEEGKVPSIIVEMMVKLNAYRGDAKGAAHAALNGSRAGKEEAELVLSLTAGLITYLYSIYPPLDKEIPF